MVGYTRSMITNIIRGTLSDQQVKILCSKYDRVGYHGKSVIYIVPEEKLFLLRDEIIAIGGQWDTERFDNMHPISLSLVPYKITKGGNKNEQDRANQ
ncbi:MAG: hypothetical protein OH335_04835 [Candidatus Parvarchaeota archaeon]|nr:hypothetical protein [Candidatus Jingweiarchaeum tengchongense]MCW1306072.1 hypothetical protein [Candidatus Jingweiarchaeum tengchongense]